MASDAPLLDRLASLAPVPALSAVSLIEGLAAPHQDPLLGPLFGVDEDGDAVVNALVPAVLQQFQDKGELTCYAALLEGLTGVWNAAVRSAVVAKLRASGLPADDLLLRLQALSPTLGFRLGEGGLDPGVAGRSVHQGPRAGPAVRGAHAARAQNHGGGARGRAARPPDRGRLPAGSRGLERRAFMAGIPANFRDLFEKKAFAHLATVSATGAPQSTPVWVDFDGTHVRVNTARGRIKDANLQANPRVALSILDPENPYRYIQVRGRVAEMTEQGADAHIDALAKKYLGQDTYPFRRPGEVRVMVKIAPERVQTMG